jgi:hypothetical protein
LRDNNLATDNNFKNKNNSSSIQTLSSKTESFVSPQFTKITSGEIVNDGADTWGLCWIDYDDDGYLDLYVVNPNMLYRNNQSSGFEMIEDDIISNDPVGLDGGCTWGDFDNNGYPDCFIANWDNKKNLFYENNGDGSFTKNTQNIIVNEPGFSIDPSCVDYDNDGYLDLFVANHDGGNFLYRNTGGDFEKITQGIIVTHSAQSNSASWSDFDNDGFMDCYVANAWDDSRDCLYHNTGDGFEKLEGQDIVETEKTTWGGSWGDYDNDGDMDIFICCSEYNSLPESMNFLYNNTGDGNFVQVENQAIVTDQGYSFSSSWGDYDNDGDLDLFVANTGINFLYQNDGIGNFSRISGEELVSEENSSGSAVWGDYDRDGDLDLFVGNDMSENNVLYKNNGNENNWINIKCIGTNSNLSAIGTKVRLKSIINGNPVWQLREISGKTGKNGQNSLNVHFGLLDANIIDSIIVEWPSSSPEIFTNIEINKFINITEGEGSVGIEEQKLEKKTQSELTFSSIFPNPAKGKFTIEFNSISDDKVNVMIFDQIGSLVYNSSFNCTIGKNIKQFNIAYLPNGLYNIAIKGKEEVISDKILIIR